MTHLSISVLLIFTAVLPACTDDDEDTVSPLTSDAIASPGSDSLDPPEDSPPPLDGLMRENLWAGGWVIGRSLKDRPIVAEQYGIGGPVLYLMSGIHGNERSAVSWSERTRSLLLAGVAERHGIRIVFIGAANPDGIAAGTRENANAIDLNRNFATDNFEDGAGDGGDTPLSEPESVAIQEAFDTTDPSAVIAVHCCVPTFDYDGPALGLATAMADAMPEDVRYPTERLGSKPGSFGSYVGVDHQTPIITLEFAPHDYLNFFEQLEALDMAIEAASQWTADNPLTGSPDSVSALAVEESNFTTTFTGTSAAGHELRIETMGPSDGPSVLLVSGLGPMSADSLLIGEHLRRVLFSDALDVRLTVFTGVNPDGIVNMQPDNNNGIQVADDLAGAQESVEAQAFQQVLSTTEPDIVIWVQADTEDRIGWTGQNREVSLPPGFGQLDIEDDSVIRHLNTFTDAVLQIGVGSQRGRVDLGRDDVFPETDPRPFSAMVRRLLVDEPPCETNGYCDVLCAVDEDCDCDCDYNAACEAAERNSQDTCLCDPNCFDGRQACDPDLHCDTWCPAGADPDCTDE